MHARVKLTTEEGIKDFLAGRIDRFSISWFKTRRDAVQRLRQGLSLAPTARTCRARATWCTAKRSACEMVQVEPVGREISAVNVPASSGTQILSELVSELHVLQGEHDGRARYEQ